MRPFCDVYISLYPSLYFSSFNFTSPPYPNAYVCVCVSFALDNVLPMFFRVLVARILPLFENKSRHSSTIIMSFNANAFRILPDFHWIGSNEYCNRVAIHCFIASKQLLVIAWMNISIESQLSHFRLEWFTKWFPHIIMCCIFHVPNVHYSKTCNQICKVSNLTSKVWLTTHVCVHQRVVSITFAMYNSRLPYNAFICWPESANIFGHTNLALNYILILDTLFSCQFPYNHTHVIVLEEKSRKPFIILCARVCVCVCAYILCICILCARAPHSMELSETI